MPGFVLVVAFFASAVGPPTPDRGKQGLARMFVEPAAAATAATVRVLGDGEEAALGAVVSADGYIATKGSELRGKLTCRLADGRTLPAEFVDYHRPTDLAMLKVEAAGLKAVEFAATDDPEVGTLVAATAPAAGPAGVGMIGGRVRKLYATEAIIENHNRGKLGVNGLRDAESTDGVIVGGVDPGQGADRAGVKPRDLIVELGGKRVKDRDAYFEVMANRRRGDEVSVKVRRDGRELTLDVRLGPYSANDLYTSQQSMGGLLSGRRTGFPQVASHDALVRASDCGGPLVDLDGNVLGLNIARAGRTESWVLPGRVVTPLLPNLKAAKYGDWLGR